MVVLQSHRVDVDEGEPIPELSAEWNDTNIEATETKRSEEPPPRRKLRSNQPKMPCDEFRNTNDVGGHNDQEQQDTIGPPVLNDEKKTQKGLTMSKKKQMHTLHHQGDPAG